MAWHYRRTATSVPNDPVIAARQKVINKIRREGLKAVCQAAGRWLHASLFQTDWDFDLVPTVLERCLRERGSVVVIQIGANIGATGSDQIHKFLRRHCCGVDRSDPPKCRAILVEPVRHLFQQLAASYADCQGIICVNAAIAEVAGTKDFYRLREGIDLARHGLPPWSEELGSFLPQQMACLWGHDPDNRELREFVEANIVVDKVSCLTFQQLREQHRIEELDLLQIDTEGYDYQILRTVDFGRCPPRYVNYERIHLGRDEGRCRRLLLANSYALHDHGQDTFCTLHERQGVWRKVRERLYAAWLDAIF